MRPRKRTDWPIVVYRYWVDPEYRTWEQFPAPIQQEAEAMRMLWNQLVEAFAQRQASYHDSLLEDTAGEIPSVSPFSKPVLSLVEGGRTQKPPFVKPVLPAPVPQAQASLVEGGAASSAGGFSSGGKPSPLVLRHIQKTFLHTTQEVSKNSPVTWGNKQFVTTQFFAALTRFFKKQSNPPQHRAGAFHELHFQHRFTEGGLPTDRIFGHSQRLSLVNVPADAFSLALSQRERKHLARTSGSFQIRDHLVRFRTILHRPLPPGAFLKAAALVGKRYLPNGYHWDKYEGHSIPEQWNWSLQLTLEVPPCQVPTQPSEANAAVQVRCELVDERHLCFGILTDATGREEALFLPEPLLGSWHHKHMLHKQAEHLLERTKQQLQGLPVLTSYPPVIQQMFSHLSAAQAPGLWRLLQSLEQLGIVNETVQILRHWAADSTKLLREARGLEYRYLGHRDWFYHNVANQLCHRYQQLVITANESKGENTTPERQEVGPYRQLAAPSRFVSFIQEAASKTGTTVTVSPRLRLATQR